MPVLSTVAFNAVTSISVIGLYISYALPILFRLTIGRADFVPGPFYLGPLSVPVGTAACAWVAFITAVFVLPTAYPVTRLTLNYAPVAVGVVLVGTLLYWVLPGVGARHWYRGAITTTHGGESELKMAS